MLSPPLRDTWGGSAAGAAALSRDLLRARLHVADEIKNLDRVRTKLLGKLVLDRLGSFLEPGLVDAIDDLHAHGLQLRCGVRLELQRHGGLALGHFVGGRLHPTLLLVRETVPDRKSTRLN